MDVSGEHDPQDVDQWGLKSCTIAPLLMILWYLSGTDGFAFWMHLGGTQTNRGALAEHIRLAGETDLS